MYRSSNTHVLIYSEIQEFMMGKICRLDEKVKYSYRTLLGEPLGKIHLKDYNGPFVVETPFTIGHTLGPTFIMVPFDTTFITALHSGWLPP
jgi:hypothetical protein